MLRHAFRVTAILAMTCLMAPVGWTDVYVHTSQVDFAGGSHDSTAVAPAGAVVVDSHGLAVYAEAGVSTPHAVLWDGSAYGAEFDALDVGATTINRIDAVSNPTTHEAVLLTLDSAGRAMAQVWDGLAISNPMFLGQGSANPTRPQAAVAYESLSGEALVVYDKGAGSPWYRIWDGMNWSAEAPVGLGNLEEPEMLVLAADPGSNRMVLMAVTGTYTDSGNAFAAIWDGDGWTDVLALRNNGAVLDLSADACFMSQSGRALVVWSDDTSQPSYRVWDGSWGAELSAPDQGRRVHQTRLEADPARDWVLMTSVTIRSGSWRKANATLWNGASWEAPIETVDKTGGVLYARAHAVFETYSGEGLAVFQDKDFHEPRYRSFDGTSWSMVQLAAAISGEPSYLTLVPDPHSNEVHLTWLDPRDGQAGTYLWDGAAFSAPWVLEPTAADPQNPTLLFLYDAHPPRFESLSMDSGVAGMDWAEIAWQSSGAADGSVRMQVAASDLDPPTAFIGPDGSSDSWYITDGGTPLALGTSGRYLRYRAEFVAGSAGEAVLDQVSVTTGLPTTNVVYTPVPLADPNRPQGLAAGDLNGDGYSDLIAAHPDDLELSVLMSLGDGSFTAPRYRHAGCAPSDLQVGDMDGDGLLDVVVAGRNPAFPSPDPSGRGLSGTGVVSILKGDGTGGLGEATSFSTGSGPVSLVLLDLDLNNNLDVVVSEPTAAGILILDGDGNGNVVEDHFVSTGSGPMGLTAGDVDRDGITDVVVCLPMRGGVLLMPGDGAGGFGPERFFSTGSSPSQVALGDLNHDGLLDVVVNDPAGGSAVVLLGDEFEVFTEPQSFQTGSGPSDLVMEETNGDCHLDVITANRVSQDVTVLLGDGRGGLVESASFTVGGAPSALVGLDVHADHKMDLIASVPSIDALVLLTNGTVPAVGFTAAVTALDCTGETYHFSATASVPGAWDSFEWDFGDGTPSQVLSDIQQGLDHQFSKAGSYRVSLVARNPVGECLAEFHQDVSVQAAVTADSGGPYYHCADAVSEPQAIITLNGTGSRATRTGSDIISYRWTEGGAGGELIATDPVTLLELPAYQAPLSVPVTLLVEDSNGCTSEDETGVTLHVVPEPKIEAEQTEVCEGESLLLTAARGYTSYLWSTGATTQAILVAPAESRTYSVLVSDGTPCDAEARVDIKVFPDDPVLLAVPAIWCTKDAGYVVEINYLPNGSVGYNLHRAAKPADLASAPVLRHVDGTQPFADIPPPGMVFYDVRGASSCRGISGP